MTKVDIEYCVPCGLLDYAVETQVSLLEEFGQDLDSVRVQPGHGGVFTVHADGELVWDKDNHDGEIDVEMITEAIRERAQAHA